MLFRLTTALISAHLAALLAALLRWTAVLTPGYGRRVLPLLAFAATGLAVPIAAQAADLEAQYRAKPTAAVAEQLARHWLEKGNIGKAMNWAERMARSPGATQAQVAMTNRWRTEYKWQLSDAGLSLVMITVSPPRALIDIDEKPVLPLTASRAVWLTEGSHTLLAEAAEYTNDAQVINAVRNERSTVEVKLTWLRKAMLRLQSTPIGPVWINGRFVANSDGPPIPLPGGKHLLEVRATNYLSWTTTVAFAPGEDKRLTVTLQRKGDDVVRRPVASQVERKLTDAERNDRAEREFGRGAAYEHTNEQNLPGKTASSKAKKEDSPPPPGPSGSNTAEADDSERSGDRGREESDADADIAAEEEAEPDAPSAPWSGRSKGLLWTVPGLALIGGGVAYAVVASQAAEDVNQRLAPSDPEFQTAYDKAALNAYIGYGAAGVGLIGTGIGAAYLFGKDGLGRSGKGTLLLSSGVLTAGMGGWLLLGAMDVAASAGKLQANDPERSRRADLASRDALVAYSVTGAGVALSAVGVWLLASKGGAASAADVDLHAPIYKQDKHLRAQAKRLAAARQRPLLHDWQVLPWSTSSGAGTASGAVFRAQF